MLAAQVQVQALPPVPRLPLQQQRLPLQPLRQQHPLLWDLLQSLLQE